MYRLPFFLFFFFSTAAGFSQQLFLEGFGGLNKTTYGLPAFSNSQTFYQVGGRLGFGADHFQIGGEYRQNISDPTFNEGLNQFQFAENYYGAFLRSKISKYPSKRFGLVLMAGAGYYSTSLTVTGANPVFGFDYEPVLGVTGGAGFSIPLVNKVMLELGYRYHFYKRSTVFLSNLAIESHRASYHSFQTALSYNLVFGKRAREYEKLEQK